MGFAKMMLICLSLIFLGVSQAQTFETTHHASDPEDGNWIELLGENSVVVPTVTLERPIVNWDYPYSVHPIYHQNQTIRGTFFGARDLTGTVDVIMAQLHYSSFMGAVEVLAGPVTVADVFDTFGPFTLNAMGDASFSLLGAEPGIYSLYVIDANSSTVLTASPLLVTEMEVEVDTPSEIFAGDLLPISVEIENESDGRPLVVGAFMVSDRDYRALTFNITGNGTINDTTISVAWNKDVFEIKGDFHPSWDLFANLLMIFPEDSAAAVQDSADGSAELYLITDDTWEVGTYVLTCCVISEGTVVGMNQTEVEIA